jgi:hypothetical protein
VIEAVALDVLAGCFTLVAGQPGDQLWPLGRQPTSRDVRVRLLNIDGVAKVQECSLPGLEQSLPTATPKPWTTTSLPLLRLAQCRIAVERSVRESIT